MQANKLSSLKIAQLVIQKPEPTSEHHHPWKTLFRSSERSTVGKTSHYRQICAQEGKSCLERGVSLTLREASPRNHAPAPLHRSRKIPRFGIQPPQTSTQSSSILSGQSARFEARALPVMTPYQTNADSDKMQLQNKQIG